jgi:hypothetical protein
VRRLTGALDYAGQKEEGCKKGEEAVSKARRVFTNDHPITAMCLGALGYNLRNSHRLPVSGGACAPMLP